MVLWRVSWKGFCSRPLRTLLTLTSIVIGVAAIVAVQLSIEDSRATQKSMLQAVTGNASLEVTSVGNAPFETTIVREIAEIAGVKVATPIIRRFGVLFDKNDQRVRVQILGVDPTIDSSIREYRIREGSALSANDQALIDYSFANSLGLKNEQPIKLMTNTGIRIANVTGLIEPTSGSAAMQGGLIIVPFPVAQRWFKAEKRSDLVQVVIDDKQSTETIREKIAALLPQGLQVREPTSRNEFGREASIATDQGLRLASAFSLMIAIFIIYNTFQMNVGERRKQFGILRALGTTRRQIVNVIVLEGLVLGVIGTLLGWALGFWGARQLSSASGALLDIPIASNTFNWLPYILGGLCGVGVAIAGAVLPARRASRLSPSEAMRTVSLGELEPSNIFLAYAGIVLSSLGLMTLIGCIQQWWHIDFAIPGTVLFLLGGIVALPTVLPFFTKWIILIISPIVGIEARLAERQLLRNRGRSSLTIGILFIALSTGLGLASSILDNIEDVKSWYENALQGDFFVRAAMPSMATGQSADMPEGLVEEFKKIPEVDSVESLRFVNSYSGDFAVVIVAREFNSATRKYFDLKLGDSKTINADVHKGDVVIGSVLAERAKLVVGDKLALNTQEGSRDFRIAGIASDYMAAGLTVYMTRAQAERLLNIQGTDAIIIDAKPDSIVIASAKVKQIALRESLLFQSQVELFGMLEEKVANVVQGLWAVLALCSIVAAFGLVNTLTMNILEQTYEIGMLRTIAMARGQVRKMIFSQALLMGIIALLPAVFAGLLIAYLLSLSNGPTVGRPITFTLRPQLTAMAFVGEMLLILLASMIPAERAARLKITDTVRFQ